MLLLKVKKWLIHINLIAVFKMNTPISKDVAQKYIEKHCIDDFGKASIWQLFRLINDLELETGEKFIRLEMGTPGLKVSNIAVEAEKKALDEDCASIYPPVDGILRLKTEISRFAKNFMNINVDAKNCIPTSGSIMAAMLAFIVAGRREKTKDTVLFLDPGFPLHKQQARMLGLKTKSFDVYDFRGKKLRAKLKNYLEKENISVVLYSNPNNPTWICFTEEELEVIGELSNKYDVIIAEDLAYFGMDFRNDISVPGQAPYQPTVANYTENYTLLVSSSKSFSYAGQRAGFLIVGNQLAKRNFKDLLEFYDSNNFLDCITIGTIYNTTGGVSHSAQHGLAALLQAINSGKFIFLNKVKEYGEKARILKKIFRKNGFNIVYSHDIEEKVADGFYFTVSFPNYSGSQLIHEFISYGIIATPLDLTGSSKPEGIRICVSNIEFSEFGILDSRLTLFKEHNA